MKCILRMLATALSGWAASTGAMYLTFGLIGFGPNGHGILLDPRYQSAKLIAVWREIEPLPKVVAQPLVIVAGFYGFAFLHAVLYRLMSPAWPQGVAPRGLRMAGLLFALCYLFWEFFTPFNQFAEPLPLIMLELAFWAIVALAEGMALAVAAEWLWIAEGPAPTAQALLQSAVNRDPAGDTAVAAATGSADRCNTSCPFGGRDDSNIQEPSKTATRSRTATVMR